VTRLDKISLIAAAVAALAMLPEWADARVLAYFEEFRSSSGAVEARNAILVVVAGVEEDMLGAGAVAGGFCEEGG
jgi:7-cyano-7-deazaguanine synthase in queuosine biosynthesis